MHGDGADPLHHDLAAIKDQVYQPLALACSVPEAEAESADYARQRPR